MSLRNANTFTMSDNYYYRKCYLERDQVPTQTVIKDRMSPELANIYFKSMTPKLKVVAGLEPPLKGGGESWFIPPKELLEGKVILKPLAKQHMAKWNCYGVDEFGMKLLQLHRDRMKAEKSRIISKFDAEWSLKLEQKCKDWEIKCSGIKSKFNTERITSAYLTFRYIYARSVTKFQDILYAATVNKFKQYAEDARKKMQDVYKELLRHQVAMLNDRYDKRIDNKKKVLQKEFIENLEIHRTEFRNTLHDINVEKHVAVEKLRHYLECQNLACQVYVALKERQEWAKEDELAKHEQKKKIKTVTSKILHTDFEIHHAVEVEKRRIELLAGWKKKACYIVKALQPFILYCLKEFPDCAEFFINMEKLMLLQLSKSLEDQTSESIIKSEVEHKTPIPDPHPFYLFCDKGYRASVDIDLCPQHATSSASQMPVIVVNKQCIYAACDKFEQFTDKIKKYIDGRLDDEIVDDHDYTRNLNVTYTASQQLRELKLEDSLQQVLQREILNLNEVSTECEACKIPFCFDCFKHDNKILSNLESYTSVEYIKPPDVPKTMSGAKITKRLTELKYEREPKWDNYLNYVLPKKCQCAKITKKHLHEHLPIYMRKMSTYDAPELLNYETCSVATLKMLVKKAKRLPKVPSPPKIPSLTKDISIQCSDIDFDYFCNCFYDQIIEASKQLSLTKDRFRIYNPNSPAHLSQTKSSFAIARALSLKRLIVQSPELEELFRSGNCMFDN